MAVAVSMIITGIAIALLVVYGADVAAGYSNENGEGFIPFDHKTRGMGLGLPALILPIVAFFISRKEPSKGLGGMIIVAGVLIIIGGAVVIGNADPEKAEETGRSGHNFAQRELSQPGYFRHAFALWFVEEALSIGLRLGFMCASGVRLDCKYDAIRV